MRRLLAGFFGVVLFGCASARPPAAPSFDTPVSPAERRAELRVLVDLRPESDCDERFDLAIYQDRGVELVTWEPGTGCTGRVATIRYFPARLSKDTLVARVRQLSQKVSMP